MAVQRVAAIFDMDYTLLKDSSGRTFIEYLYRTGQFYNYFRRRDLLTFTGAGLLYKLGLLDPTWLLVAAGRASAGRCVNNLWDLSRKWFTEKVVHLISEAGQERLKWHRDQGHIPVICSGSSQFAVHLLAEYLEIEEWICTEWLIQDGLMTGELRQPLTYGAGKVYWMEHWANHSGVDLGASYFYTDHISDRPLLERVAHPVAVNPDRRLARIARQRTWEVMYW
jgi:putative phosphoserine phosphatase / 1-acylglycerol-3-phosphate O-acyltransferase